MLAIVPKQEAWLVGGHTMLPQSHLNKKASFYGAEGSKLPIIARCLSCKHFPLNTEHTIHRNKKERG
jgi:hypothetical protein